MSLNHPYNYENMRPKYVGKRHSSVTDWEGGEGVKDFLKGGGGGRQRREIIAHAELCIKNIICKYAMPRRRGGVNKAVNILARGNDNYFTEKAMILIIQGESIGADLKASNKTKGRISKRVFQENKAR